MCETTRSVREHRWIVDWFTNQVANCLYYDRVHSGSYYLNLYDSNNYFITSNESSEFELWDLNFEKIKGINEELFNYYEKLNDNKSLFL